MFQTICHALGFTVTKSGISDFYISINYGKVSPKKVKTGLFEWIANVFLFIGPFFIPAFLILLCLFFLMNGGFNVATPEHLLGVKYTFAGQINTFGASLHSFSTNFYGFLFNIDLLHPSHFGFLLLLIFLGMGIRPSYLGEQKQEKVDMLYDLKNIWSLITLKPLYVVILFLFAYVIFYISFYLNQIWYVALFSVFGWLSIIAITSIIITDSILCLIKATDTIQGVKKFLPYIMLPLSYVLARLFFFYFPSEFTNFASLIIMIILTTIVTYLLIKPKTNKFKSKLAMKLSRKKNKGESDEGRGTTEK